MKKPTDTNPEQLMEQAWKKFNKKDFDGAEVLFSGISEQDQHFDEAQYGQAACLLRKKDYSPAIDILDSLIKMYPKDFKFYHTRALCYGGEENYDAALSDLEKALELAGERHDLYFDIGGTLLAARDYKRAAQYFEKCIDLDNKCYEAWVGKALAAYYNKELKAAFEFANISLKFNPKSILALLLKTEVLLETGKKSDVEKEAKKLRSLDSDIFKRKEEKEDYQKDSDRDDYDVDEDAYRTEDDEIEDFKLDD